MSKKILGPEVGYTDLLDFHTSNKLAKESDAGRKYTPLRPSAAGKCTRELAYEFAEFRGRAAYPKEGMKPSVHRLLNLGHSIEYNILNQFKEVEGFELKYSQQVLSFFPLNETGTNADGSYKEDYWLEPTIDDQGKSVAQVNPKYKSSPEWVEGSLDRCFYVGEHKAVIDIKSKGDKYSSWNKSRWDDDNEKLEGLKSVQRVTDTMFWVDDLDAFLGELNDPFLASNFYQLNMYANAQFLKERGVDHAAIIQYNKNDSRLREIRFRPSESVYENVKSKFQTVGNSIDAGLSPSDVRRDYALGSIKCAFCSFKKECHPQEDGLKAYFKTWGKKTWPEKATPALEQLKEQYETVSNSKKELERLEKLWAMQMIQDEIQKAEFKDGTVYEVKTLKGDGLVMRRTKK